MPLYDKSLESRILLRKKGIIASCVLVPQFALVLENWAAQITTICN